jgi:hypothetical protein
MTRIICRASECVYWEDGLCSSEEIEYDPDAGCLTFEDVSEAVPVEEEEAFDWGDESDEELFDEDGDSEEELWADDDEDEIEEPWQDDWDDERI